MLFLGLYPDFSVYYYGSKFFSAGQNPYLSGQALFSGYSYPPIVFLLFIPFTFLPFQISEVSWIFLNVAFLITAIIFLTKIFSISFFSRVNLLLSSFVFLSFPTKFTLGMGQMNIVILLLLVLSLYFIKQKKDFYGGLLLGVSLMLKLFPLLLPFYFIIRLKKEILLGIFSSIIGATFLVVLFVPTNIYLYFMSNVVPYFFSSSWKLEYYSQSLSAFVGRTFGVGDVGVALKIGLTLTIVLITFFIVLKKQEKDFLATSLIFGFLITATMLINTFSWQHHFVWLIIPFYATTFYLIKKRFGKSEFIMLGVSYFLVSINFKNPEIIPVLFRSHVFYGTLILFFVNARLLFLKKQK
ncbi:MAG: glycosyltransferase family 87 protein [Candidatus Levybacteria bacterium]|nr:glycosyltransferase family 87 protein [Candidatus Levybacteria bacterium]